MFSPPFSEQDADEAAKYFPRKHRETIKPSEFMSGNIQNLPYGQIDKIITSPPYAASANVQQQERVKRGYFKKKDGKPASGFLGKMEVPERDDNIGNLPYGEIDAVITSPHYQAFGASREGEKIRTGKSKIHKEKSLPTTYTKEQTDNLGNLQGDTYLSAMKLVYEQCYKVLKPGGLMILVVKNFIRNKKEIDLKADTRGLCEQAGFEFIEEHYRLLTSQSFWRTIYARKYPDAPKIDKEYILVFKR